MGTFNIQSGTWQDLATDAKIVRTAVFIEEQQIAAQDEWDAEDASAQHFVVYAENEHARVPIATARLLNNNSIGRVAVLKAYRGQGIGRMLMLQLLLHAKNEQRACLTLSAQCHAVEFYQSLGFQQQGDAYSECGIAHVRMSMPL